MSCGRTICHLLWKTCQGSPCSCDLAFRIRSTDQSSCPCHLNCSCRQTTCFCPCPYQCPLLLSPCLSPTLARNSHVLDAHDERHLVLQPRFDWPHLQGRKPHVVAALLDPDPLHEEWTHLQRPNPTRQRHPASLRSSSSMLLPHHLPMMRDLDRAPNSLALHRTHPNQHLPAATRSWACGPNVAILLPLQTISAMLDESGGSRCYCPFGSICFVSLNWSASPPSTGDTP